MTDDKDKRPRKRATKKKSVIKKVTDEDKIRDKITEAIRINLEEFADKKQLSQKQMNVINSFIEEHLSCFVLIGYNNSGEPISLINAKTPKDSDSLGTLLHKFMSKYIEPPQMPPVI